MNKLTTMAAVVITDIKAKINNIIDKIPCISDIRKSFYKKIIKSKYNDILKVAYNKRKE